MNYEQRAALLDIANFLVGEGPYTEQGPIKTEKFDMSEWQAPTQKSINEYFVTNENLFGACFRKVELGYEPNYCKTAACAIGWGCLLPSVKALGLFLDRSTYRPNKLQPAFSMGCDSRNSEYINEDGQHMITGFEAVCFAFGINRTTAENLFGFFAYAGEDWTGPSDITPAQVANRIRNTAMSYPVTP